MKEYRKHKTNEERQAILDEAHVNGISNTAKKYNLNPITIRRWRNPELHKKNQDKFKHKRNKYYKKFIERNNNYQRESWRRWKYNNLEKSRIQGKESALRQKLKRQPEINRINRERCKIRYREDSQYRILCCLRSRVYQKLKEAKVEKSKTTLELLGCSMDEFKLHIEKQFQNGMSWENYGEWEIDHIIPCSAFDLTIPENQQKCFHYTNCQPLLKIENRIKQGMNKIETRTYIEKLLGI